MASHKRHLQSIFQQQADRLSWLQQATIKCCKKFSFQYNGLLYCGACILSSKATDSTPAISDKRDGKLFSQDTSQTLSLTESTIKEYKTATSRQQFGIDLVWAQQFRSDYYSTQAVVRL